MGLEDLTSFNSGDYWRDRYLAGGHSGAGAYGRLAVYKAHVVNLVTHSRKVRTVIEFGSGDGNTASLFHIPRYTGVDLSQEALARARERAADRGDWRWMTLADFKADPQTCDMAMSLDVIYHLVEDEVFDDYMRRLFTAARRLVLVYSSDHSDGEATPAHVRHRAYSDWIAREAPDWSLAKTWNQPYPFGPGTNPRHTSFAFFRLFRKAAPGAPD